MEDLETFEGTQPSKKQRWNHQEEPALDSHFSCYSSTLKPIQAQPNEPYSKNINIK